jgi:hypothetical protein
MSTPLAIVLLTASIAILSRCEARAQDEITVARLVVHEAGWQSPADADAIAAVVLNGAARTGMTPARYALVYAPRFAAGTTGRAWVHRLDAAGHDPRLAINWQLHRPLWLALIERCRAALRSPPICAATDWSSPSHMRRRLRRGAAFRVVDCGLTVNVFAVRGVR